MLKQNQVEIRKSLVNLGVKNRSRIDVLYDLISVANKSGVRKTHLMYGANLSYQQLNLYLDLILRNGLLKECIVDESKYYVITTKGWQFLAKANEAKGLLGNLEEDGIFNSTLQTNPKQGSEETIEKFVF